MSRSVGVSIVVNGRRTSHSVDPRTLLVHYLRDRERLTGTHVGCDTSNCGACTVMVDGETVKSCTILAVQADGCEVTTVEGLSGPFDGRSAVQEGFRQCHGLQCGFCTPGMITRAHRLLQENPSPTEEEVRFGMAGNLCRCTGYQNIVKAIMAAAAEMNAKEAAE